MNYQVDIDVSCLQVLLRNSGMNFPLSRSLLPIPACLFILTMIILLPTQSIADIRLNADWENGALIDYYSKISGNQYGVQIVDTHTSGNPVCTGNKSLMSTLEYGNGTYRSEITVNQSQFNSLEMGQRHWFSFAIYLPDDYKPDTAEDVLWQMHGRPDIDSGELYRNPPLAIRTKDNAWVISYIKDSRYITYKAGDTAKNYEESGQKVAGNFETGKWTTFVIDTLWDYRSHGYVKIWKDGEIIFEKTNGIGYNDTKGPYVKMGIYKRSWDSSKSWGGPSNVSKRTTYIDDFKVGGANATYDEMLPRCTSITDSLITTTSISPPSGLSFSVK